MMCTYFDIMADTARDSRRMVSPLFGLNRTNDNILLYNHSCTDVLMSCKASPKLYKKINNTHFLFKILSVIRRVRLYTVTALYLHCKKYRPIISAISTKINVQLMFTLSAKLHKFNLI